MSFTQASIDEVIAVTQRGPARLQGGRLLCLDGPAGSGKTTLAAHVGDRVHAEGGRVEVIRCDELLDGWDGELSESAATLVHDVLEPLARGERAAYARYDWVARRFAERVPVPTCDLLIVEGVGAGSRTIAPFAAALVWLEAEHDLRRDRGVARDGEVFAAHWESWARKEAQHFAREGTRERADLVLSTDAGPDQPS